MKKLILLTNAFPYGTWEPFLETEVKYFNKFDEIIIFALQTRSEMLNIKRDINHDNVKIYPIKYLSRLEYFFKAFYALFDKNFYNELIRLIKNKSLSIKKIISLFVYLSRANHEYKMVLKNLNLNDLESSLIYSYRFEYQPYIAVKLKERFNIDLKIISRAHGIDLYEYRRASCYIPFREFLLQKIDKVYPCSIDGENYLQQLFPEYKSKIKARYLGTISRGVAEYKLSDKIKIISCSRTDPIKRIDKIINALGYLVDYDIRWEHYGDGDLTEELLTLASKKLNGKIEYEFMGNVPNNELLEKYKKGNYYFFINVSESEGLPVSIMEALSFGIPCIATDAGGTREIINDNINGYLLNVNVTPKELSKSIINMINLDKNKYSSFRINARKIWEDKFDANINYKRFIDEIVRYF